jgi:hypothetical protein
LDATRQTGAGGHPPLSTTPASTGNGSIPIPEGLLITRPLCAPAGPDTARGSNISPHFPLLPADVSLQVVQESKTLPFRPLCHSSLRVCKIGTHFKDIHLAILVAIREFFSEGSTASA